MNDLITISTVAKELGVSYHVARNRLLRNPSTIPLRKEVDGNVVVYDKKVLEILRKCNP